MPDATFEAQHARTRQHCPAHERKACHRGSRTLIRFEPSSSMLSFVSCDSASIAAILFSAQYSSSMRSPAKLDNGASDLICIDQAAVSSRAQLGTCRSAPYVQRTKP